MTELVSMAFWYGFVAAVPCVPWVLLGKWRELRLSWWEYAIPWAALPLYYALLSAARVSGYDPMWIYGLVLLPVATSAYFLWRLLLADSARRRFARAISACAALATFGVLWGFCYTLTS